MASGPQLGAQPDPSRFPYPGRPQSPGGAPGAQGQVIRARQVIVFGPAGSGIFVYSGTPAHGNLVYSIAAASGTDPYGNAYVPGATTYLGNPPSQLYTNMFAGGLLFNGGSSIAGINLNQSGVNGQLQISSINPVLLQGASFVAASGDTTGVTDRQRINTALARGYCVLGRPPAGVDFYWIDQPLTLPSNALLDGGGATVKPAAGFTGAGMLTLSSGAVQNTTVTDVTLLDNYTIAGPLDGVHYVTSNSVPNNSLRRVVSRGFTGNGFYIQATSNSASAHLNDCVAYGNFLDGFLLSSDQLVVNCEAGFNMGHGFHLAAGASNVYLSNCLAWYSGVNPQTSVWPASGTSCGYFLEAPTQYSHLVGCHAQQNGLHGYAVGPTSGTAGFCYECSITGCGADTNSAYGAGGVGSGIFVSGVQSCVIANNVGDNNGGLSPGSQLWGVQAPGGLVTVQFHGNTITGTSGRAQIASRWTNMSLVNGWVNNGAFVAAKYALTETPARVVEIIGSIDGTAASNVIFANLPAGFRPATAQGMAVGCTSSADSFNLRCAVNGDLSIGNLAVPAAQTFFFHGFISLDA